MSIKVKILIYLFDTTRKAEFERHYRQRSEDFKQAIAWCPEWIWKKGFHAEFANPSRLFQYEVLPRRSGPQIDSQGKS